MKTSNLFEKAKQLVDAGYDGAPLWKKINISDNEKGYYVNSNTGIVLFRFRCKLENYLKNLPEKKQQEIYELNLVGQ